MKHNSLLYCLPQVIAGLAIMAVKALIVMVVWNLGVNEFFNMPKVTYLVSFGICWICPILFKTDFSEED